MAAFNDILFDARKLAKLIGPASWGQGFAGKQDDCGAYPRGSGISLARVIDCLKDARRNPAPNEGYTRDTPDEIFFDLVKLTLDKNPLCKSGAMLVETMGRTYEESARNFSAGEKVLIKVLWDIKTNEDKFKFYLLFQERLDRLLEKMLVEPVASIVEG